MSRLALLVAGAALVAGCSSFTVGSTDRSAVQQEVVVRSIERAIARVDTKPLEGRRVSLDLHGLSKDQDFARELLTVRLRARGVEVVSASQSPGLSLKAFATVLGMDQAETLIGIPALQVPVVSIPIPEIAIFKWSQNRGHTELQLFVFDEATGRLVEELPRGIGRSKYDNYKLLILIGFAVSDLDEPESPTAAKKSN